MGGVGFGGEFLVAFFLIDEAGFFHAGGAEGAVFVDGEGGDFDHAATVWAAGFGGFVLGFVFAVAVFAPVADGVFEAAMAGEIFAALAAAFDAVAGGRNGNCVVINGVRGGVEGFDARGAGAGFAMSGAGGEIAATDGAEGGGWGMRGGGHSGNCRSKSAKFEISKNEIRNKFQARNKENLKQWLCVLNFVF